MPGPGEQAQNAEVQEANANAQNQVALEDFNENEDHVTEAKYRQKTRIDSIWYNMEYNVKNYILTFGDEFPEDQREKYGFRLTGKKDENDEAMMYALDNDLYQKAAREICVFCYLTKQDETR